jgi:hypothetical protein
MENQVVCPNCKKVLPDDVVISDAAKGVGSFMRFIYCECGEKISYWQITAQLRKQKTMGWRFRNWVHAHNQA